mmetsp:Transcript_56389/g.132239  ORF Transcript_56389/g.132239 Transcript_56389/m.132239 type:complete len:413 (-) Transcript_56389:13-1251(-)
MTESTIGPRLWLPIALGGISSTALAYFLWRRKHGGSKGFHLEDIVRPPIRKAAPYHFPPRYEYKDPVLLDANENPFGPPHGGKDPSLAKLQLERYPDPAQTDLKAAVSKLRGVPTDQILFGVGSDEVIDLLIRVFCEPSRDSILVCPPTYAMYRCFADLHDVRTVEVPRTSDYCVQPQAVSSALTSRTKVVFLCSPGNPSSVLIDRAAIIEILEAAQRQPALVVVDEAYIDFAQAADSSIVPLLQDPKYPNLAVMQTFSKAWGMAGARLGMLFASSDLISIMNKVKAPFNISTLVEDAALQALKHADVVKDRVGKILDERERVATALQTQEMKGLGIQEVKRSDANFLLVKMQNAKAVSTRMGDDSNVTVRYRGGMLHCKDCIRITIGTKAENDAMLKALAAALRKNQPPSQ